MGIILSLLTIAVGAILRFAVSASVEGVDLETIGNIILIVGIVGFVLSIGAEVMKRNRKTETVVERGGQPVERSEVKDRL